MWVLIYDPCWNFDACNACRNCQKMAANMDFVKMFPTGFMNVNVCIVVSFYAVFHICCLSDFFLEGTNSRFCFTCRTVR